jgi:hypothetical protein
MQVDSAKPLALVSWSTEILFCLVRQIITCRNTNVKNAVDDVSDFNFEYVAADQMVIDEVQEIVELPMFKPFTSKVNSEADVIDAEIRKELYAFVSVICSLYRGTV